MLPLLNRPQSLSVSWPPGFPYMISFALQETVLTEEIGKHSYLHFTGGETEATGRWPDMPALLVSKGQQQKGKQAPYHRPSAQPPPSLFSFISRVPG